MVENAAPATWMKLEIVILVKKVREGEISYNIAYMQNLKGKWIHMGACKTKQTHTLREQTYGYCGKRMGGRTVREFSPGTHHYLK